MDPHGNVTHVIRCTNTWSATIMYLHMHAMPIYVLHSSALPTQGLLLRDIQPLDTASNEEIINQ